MLGALGPKHLPGLLLALFGQTMYCDKSSSMLRSGEIGIVGFLFGGEESRKRLHHEISRAGLFLRQFEEILAGHRDRFILGKPGRP